MSRHQRRWHLTALLGLAGSLSAFAGPVFDPLLDEWLNKEKVEAVERMLANVSPADTARGVVVASPSKDNPNYFYHWVRDAGIVMTSVVDLYQTENDATKKRHYFHMLLDYISFSRKNQTVWSPSGMGEPKFEVDGNAFTGPWGRPQNDGPALRAIALSKLAMLWLAEGREALVRELLYENEIPAYRVVKADLEFLSHHWRETNFDLWEEIRGQHFYTQMVQRRALIDGAKLAAWLGDYGASGWYLKQAGEMEAAINKHWDGKQKILISTIERDAGIDYKWSGLDSSVVLGVLHGATKDGFFLASDERLLSTIAHLEETFEKLYPINQNGQPGITIGRYPEDRYDGYKTDGQGNGWILLTAGFAEAYYQIARELESQGGLTITSVNRGFFKRLGEADLTGEVNAKANGPAFSRIVSKLRVKGDDFLRRLQSHAGAGHFAEQLNRWTGYQQGAPHLTWSYGAFLTAAWNRPQRALPQE